MIKQGLKTFKKPALLLSASLGLWLGVSCQDDITTGQSLPLGDEIQFSIASDSIGENQSVGTVSRSASRVSTHFLTVIGEDSLYLEVKEEENNRPFYTATEDTVESRGASYDTEKQPLKSFFLTAFLEDGAQFMKDEEVKKNGNDWEYSPIKYWPQNQAVHFFGYARSKENGTLDNHNYTRDEKNGSYTHTFDYTMPSGDATNQPDLIVAITPNQTKQSINGKVMMSFKHALSAIVFKVGEVPNETKLKSITFSGLYASGTGQIDQTSTITWSEHSGSGTYAQTFDMDVTDKDATGEKTETVVSTKDQETCFMMIPQEFKTDKAKITFSFAIGPNGKDYTVSMALNEILRPNKLENELPKWEANKLYTFTIKLPDDVKVKVNETFTEGSNVKKDVYISNPSVSKIYVRATVVGCWINANGDALASWIAPDNISATAPEGADGKFVLPDGWSNSWLVGNDGYYYYKNPISYGENTTELFDSYTLTAAPPVAGTTLELSVIAQSVYAEDITLTGWPVTVSTNNVLISKE